jgi:O-antigen ligase
MAINRQIILFLSFLLCVGTLFVSSAAFVNAQITPKWYCFAVGALAVLVALVARFFFPPKAQQPGSMAMWFGAIAASTCTAQALYGALQYAGALPATNGFRVTGSFDNPAGFAASLCAAFPFLLYFAFGKSPWQRGLTWIAAGVVAVAVALSASRAGVFSLVVVCAAASFYKFPRLKKYKAAMLTLCLLVLAGLYLQKKDSANGRMLIWRCSWEMVKEKPLLGYGAGGFKAGYMSVQAKYFEEHPDSELAMLAGNVNRPFNEYVGLAVSYGLAGVFLLFFAGWFIRKSYLRCKNTLQARMAAWCLLAVAVFACFSYPLAYPFVWVVSIFSGALIVYHAKYRVKISPAIWAATRVALVPAVAVAGVVATRRMADEMRWCAAAHKSLRGQTEQMLPVYRQLYKSLSKNE